MRAWILLLIAFATGFGAASYLGRTERKLVRSDQITIKRTELDQLIRGIESVRDKRPDGDLISFEADSGSFSIECPNPDACNVLTGARYQAQASGSSQGQALTANSRAGVHRDVLKESAAAPLAQSAAASADREMERASRQLFDDLEDDEDYQVMAKYGLEEGDSIVAINEEEMASPDEAVARLDELTSKNAVIQSMAVIRRGERVTLNYTNK